MSKGSEPIRVLSVDDHPILRDGIAALIATQPDISLIAEAIRAVHTGQKRIPAELATELADHAADDELTAREIEVLRSIAAGNSNKLIGDKLSVTEETIKGHVKNIFSKLRRERSHPRCHDRVKTWHY